MTTADLLTKLVAGVLGLFLLTIAWGVLNAALHEQRCREAEAWARNQISEAEGGDDMSKHSQEVAADCLDDPVPCLNKHHGHQEGSVTVEVLIDRAVKAREGLRLNWPDRDLDEPDFLRKIANREFPTAVLPIFRERAEPWYR